MYMKYIVYKIRTAEMKSNEEWSTQLWLQFMLSWIKHLTGNTNNKRRLNNCSARRNWKKNYG